MVERPAVNRNVAGSSPASGANLVSAPPSTLSIRGVASTNTLPPRLELADVTVSARWKHSNAGEALRRPLGIWDSENSFPATVPRQEWTEPYAVV